MIMRVVIVGASEMGSTVAEHLVGRGHEVVVIDLDQTRLDTLSDTLDCGLIQGDGTAPDVLREAMGGENDILFAATDFDQDNILSALIARSIGFKRVIPQIMRADHRPICDELGLQFAIAPHVTIAHQLVNLIENRDVHHVDSSLEGNARMFGLVLHDKSGVACLGDIELPPRSCIVCVFRDSHYLLPEDCPSLKSEDRVLILTDVSGSEQLHQKYGLHVPRSDEKGS